MVADPNAIPFTLGGVTGAVAPAGMSTAEVTVTLELSLLLNVMNKATGLGAARAIANGADCPGATVTFAGNKIPARFVSEKSAAGETPVTEALTV